MFRTLLTIALGVMVMGLLGFSSPAGAQKKRAASRPTISLSRVKSDIVGKSVENVTWEESSSRATRWTFAADEPREIEILKALYGKEHAVLTITLYSKAIQPRPDGLWITVGGNLRLQYDRVVGGWLLASVEDISFKYAIRDADGTKLNQHQLEQRVAATRQQTYSRSTPSSSSPIALVNNSFAISPGKHQYFPFTLTGQATVSGRFNAQGGSGNDIKVYILDADSYVNFKNGHQVNTFYNSGQVTVGNISAVLGAGTYYLVFDNGYSILSNKAVSAVVSYQYQ